MTTADPIAGKITSHWKSSTGRNLQLACRKRKCLQAHQQMKSLFSADCSFFRHWNASILQVDSTFYPIVICKSSVNCPLDSWKTIKAHWNSCFVFACVTINILWAARHKTTFLARKKGSTQREKEKYKRSIQFSAELEIPSHKIKLASSWQKSQ